MSNFQLAGAAPPASSEEFPDGSPVCVRVSRIGGTVILEVKDAGGVGFLPAHAHQLGLDLIDAASRAAS